MSTEESMATAAAFRTTLTAAPLLCTGRLLDTIPRAGSPLGVAFSVRKVSTAYRGPCVRVRRSSDNREQDIGFLQTDLDYKTLLTFCAGFDGFVTTWYDQSGQGRHATQNAPASQPRIVAAGSLILDKNGNQISIEFNGTFLKTTWEPNPANMAAGAGIAAATSNDPGVQPGTVSETQYPALDVPTDNPNPLLPEGYDTYLLEGMQVNPQSGIDEVVFTQGGMLTHLEVDTSSDTMAVSSSDVITPGGPPSLTVSTLPTGIAATVSQWRRGLKLHGRIFAIPYNASQVLEISSASPPSVTAIDLPGIVTLATTAKWWMAVADPSGTIGYCIPYNAEYVLKIDATTTPATLSVVGQGESNGSFGTLQGKWADGVLVSGGNGRIYAVPLNATSVLEINPVTGTATTLGSLNGGQNNGGLFLSAATKNGKAFGIPWNAGTLLVVDATTSTASVGVYGTTGLTSFVSGTAGRGYTRAPQLFVTPPDGGGTTMKVTATVQLTRTTTSVAVTTQGTGYVSSPIIRVGGVSYGVVAYPVFAPVMALVDSTQPRLGYKIDSITITNGGDGWLGNPGITVDGGKGTAAQAQAVVVNGSIIAITIPAGGGGSGYTTKPTVVISGGNGSGATADVNDAFENDGGNMTPVVYTTVGGVLSSTGGGLVGSIRVVNGGSGYTSAPRVSFSGGKGITATATTSTTIDGKIGQITVSSPGSGYTAESFATISVNAGVRQILIGAPGDSGGNPAGTRAVARIATINGSGGITSITMVNCGSGYVAPPSITFVSTTGTGAIATATVEQDGRINDIVLDTSAIGTTYTRRPTITGFNDRIPLDGSLDAVTPGSAANGLVYLEGRSGGATRSAYVGTGRMPSGLSKFVGAYVPPDLPGQPRTTIFALPYATNRVLAINTETYAMADVFPSAGGDFGVTIAQHVEGVATRDGERYYGIPYGRKQLLKITAATSSAELIPKPLNGNWNYGVAAWNQNIYCMPADGSALLVIDTKQELKSDVVTFTNIRGPARNKWWAAVLAGSTSADGLIYGIPADIDGVLELNPGVPLRAKQLPAAGCVLPDKKSIVFCPSNGNVMRYDVTTKTSALFSVPTTANVTYAEGVALPDGNVVFIPSYNPTDAFAYQGNVGLFNAVSNVFTYGPRVPNIDWAAPYPSRTGTALGTSLGKLISWVPREGPNAIITYDHVAGTVVASTAQRAQTKVAYAASQRVGAPDTATKMVVVQPSVTNLTIRTAPVYTPYGTVAGGGGRSKFVGAVLTRQNTVVVVPGEDVNYIVVFHPLNPTAPLDRTKDNVGSLVTRINLPTDLTLEYAAIDNLKFSGGVLGSDGRVFCIPFHRTKILAIDPVTYDVEEFGDLGAEYLAVGNQGLYWGSVLGSDGKMYCVPHNARRVMVIDPSIPNPANRISFLGDTFDAGGAKWRGGALGPDGRIFCAPFNATTVLIIDPTAGTTSTTTITGYLNTVNSSQTGKYCDAVVGANKRIYFIPYNNDFIVDIDPVSATIVRETDCKVVGTAKWSSAAVGRNGKIYTVPYAHSEALEYDPDTDDIVKYGGTAEYVLQNNTDGARWGCIVVSRTGTLYAFPSWRTEVLEYSPDGINVNVYNRAGDSWLQCGPVSDPYKLRPFALSDGETVALHTPGTAAYAIFKSNNATAETQAILGTPVRDGIAMHFPDLNDRILSVRGNVITKISPYQGGVAGVKSFSGTADLFLGIDKADVIFNVGNASIDVKNIYNNVFSGGKPGVYSALASAMTGDVNLYVRDVPLSGKAYEWTGQVGNVFSVGRVEGTLTPSFGAPGYTRGFSGLISEIVVFTSDQQTRAATLGENTSFYFLDSKLQIQQ